MAMLQPPLGYSILLVLDAACPFLSYPSMDIKYGSMILS